MRSHDKDVTLFYPMEWTVTPRPGHEGLLAETMRWGVARGVVRPGSPSERSLSLMRSDVATVLAYPEARGDSAQFISDFIGWYLLLDDNLESACHGEEELSRMPGLFAQYLEALAFLRAPREREASNLLRGALDLGARVRALSSAAWQARFRESMRTYFHHGVLPEVQHRVRGTLPSLMEYVDLRVDSSGSYPIFDLIEIASGHELPADIADHRLIRDVRRSAAITISWANDILSFHKERGGARALNLPMLLMSDCDLGEDQAIRSTVGIHNAEMRHYLSLKREALNTAALDHPAVRPWLRGLDIVMRGLLEWQLLAARYTRGRSLTVQVAAP